MKPALILEPLPALTGGLKIEGEDDSFDFGSGAGFYLDATKAPWNKGYKMYSYITSELPKTVFENFKQVDSERVSIFGHSMGGHGALTLVSEDFSYGLLDYRNPMATAS